jgi:hypothetical protein
MIRLALAALCCSALALPAAGYDPAHLAQAQSGDDCLGCDLTGADLQNAQLDGVLLMDARLGGADLSGSNLYAAQLDGADLTGAKLAGADLRDASLLSATLDGADLTNAEVADADFTGASLKGTNVTGANFAQAIGADLSAAVGKPKPAAVPPPAPPTGNADLRVGSVFLVAFDYCPLGSMEADGSTLTIQDHQILFSLYGPAYGGDGKTDFKLPDLRAQVPLPAMRYCVVAVGTYPARS